MANLIMTNWYIKDKTPYIVIGTAGENNATSISIECDEIIENAEYFLDIGDTTNDIFNTQELTVKQQITPTGEISNILYLKPMRSFLGKEGVKLLQVRCEYIDNDEKVTKESNVFHAVVNKNTGFSYKFDVAIFQQYLNKVKELAAKVAQDIANLTLGDLKDTNIVDPTNGQVIKYDAETQKWVNGEGGGSSSGDMLASVYDPNGNIAEAGGIEEYVKDKTPRYNVLDYGLVGDGVTDNSQAFETMLSAISDNGCVIYFPEGKYLFHSPVTITKNGVTLMGDSRYSKMYTSGTRQNSSCSVLIYDGNADTTFMSNSATNYLFSLYGLQFECLNGYSATLNDEPFSGTLPYSTIKETIVNDNINAVDTSVNGTLTNVNVEHCIFYGFSGYGIKISNHIFVKNCVFKYCKVGVQFTGTDHWVQNSWFNNCHTGILREYNANMNYSNLSVTDTWMDMCINGIYMDVTTCMLLIKDIWFDMFDTAAIICTGYMNNSHIDGRVSRAGMSYAGILDADRTRELGAYTDAIHAKRIYNSIINVATQKRKIGQGKNANGICPSRVVSTEEGKMLYSTITDVTVEYADLYDSTHDNSFTDTSFHSSTRETENIKTFVYDYTKTIFTNGSPINYVYPLTDIACLCVDTTNKKIYRSTGSERTDWELIAELPDLSEYVTQEEFNQYASENQLSSLDGYANIDETIYSVDSSRITYGDGYVNYDGTIRASSNFRYAEMTVLEGETIRLTGITGGNVKLYALIDANDSVISLYPSQTPTANTLEIIDITIPMGAVKLRVSSVKNLNPEIYVVSTEEHKIIQDYQVKDIGGVVKSNNFVEDTITLNLTHGESTYNGTTVSLRNNINVWGTTITVASNEKYHIRGTAYLYTVVYIVFDSAHNVLSYSNLSNDYTSQITIDTIVTIPNNGAYMYVASYGSYPIVSKVSDIPSYETGNVLYNKKWAVCGDSFTEGNFIGYVDPEGHTGIESDAYDPIMGMYKTYPWWITKRNNMNILMLAKGGNDFTNISGALRPFSSPNTDAYNYTQIPNDCDYVTLMFGLNETQLTTEQIGTNTDTTNETLWGAYNIVLESILTANPSVKIGIIISDAWMTQTYHDALIDIAKYWGIPYLDLKNGELVPMGIDGRLSECSTVATTLRNSAFQVTPTNNHPNVISHKYRSTIIENFLRSL